MAEADGWLGLDDPLEKRRSNDEEMLELLAPFAGHRGRVQAMLKSAALR